MSEKRTYSLSIYLHKSTINSYEECLTADALQDNLERFLVSSKTIGVGGVVYVSSSNPKAPNWESDINIFTNSEIELEESVTNRGLVILLVEGRYMSITFGYGRYLIDESTIVSDFGLRVAANLIDSSQLRSLTTMNIEDIVIDIQKQSSAFSTQEQLQIDTYREILREIAGAPNRRAGDAAPKFIVGTNLLKTTKKLNLENILDDLKYYKNIYQKTTYKNNGFRWIDNVQRINDKELLSSLNDLLVDSILSKQGHIQIAANQPIDWSNLDGFFLSGFDLTNQIENYDLIIQDKKYFDNIYENVKEKGKSLNVLKKLKRDELYILNSQSGNREKLSNVYDSIIFEDKYKDNYYLLTHGEWFKVNENYYEDLLNELKEIEIETDLKFIDFDENRAAVLPDKKYYEEDYNKDLADSSDEYKLFDKKLFRQKYHKNNPIEPCDVFTKNKELIHVKRYNGSSSMSHLLAQGMVSGSLLANIDFRNFINETAGEEIIHADDNIRDFKIVFAIVHKDRDENELGILPFFTKINLVQTARQFKMMQLNYSIKKINIIPKISK